MLHTQQQLIDLAAKRTNSNHAELAKLLGVVRQAVSQFKFGGPMSSTTAINLAKLCGLPAEYVVACTDYSRLLRLADAESDEKRRAEYLRSAKVYEKIAKRLAEFAERPGTV